MLNDRVGMNSRQSIAAIAAGGSSSSSMKKRHALSSISAAWMHSSCQCGVYTGEVATPFMLDVERPE